MSEINTRIEDFLKQRPGTVYSLRTIARNIGTKRRKVSYCINNNSNIIRCDSYEVGSSKGNLRLYKML